MLARAAFLASWLVVLAGIASTVSAERPSPSFFEIETPAAPLHATAEFVDWTWFGPGSPCGGGSITMVAHFAGNATGGVGPYSFEWIFHDGTNGSSAQAPSHVYSSNSWPWNVTLTVTDAAAMNSSAEISVWPAAFSCPAALAPPISVLGLLIVLGGLSLAVAAGAVASFILFRRWWKRRRS